MAESAPNLLPAGTTPRSLDEESLCQPRSIVSRIPLRDETEMLAATNCDAGRALSAHAVPRSTFVQGIDGRAATIRAEKIVPLPGGMPHKVRAVQRFKMTPTGS